MIITDNNSLEQTIEQTLTALGFDKKYLGYTYACDYIRDFIKTNNTITASIELWYDEEANRCHTTASCINRELRTLIRNAVVKETSYLTELFSLSERCKPKFATNRNMLVNISNHILRATNMKEVAI